MPCIKSALRSATALVLTLVLGIAPALAQSSPNFSNLETVARTGSQWNSYFASKADYVNLLAEVSRAKAAEQAAQSLINTNSTAITNETTRAQNAEQANTSNIASNLAAISAETSARQAGQLANATAAANALAAAQASLQPAKNLSDLASAATARSNLGLGSLATLSTLSGLDGSGVNVTPSSGGSAQTMASLATLTNSALQPSTIAPLLGATLSGSPAADLTNACTINPEIVEVRPNLGVSFADAASYYCGPSAPNIAWGDHQRAKIYASGHALPGNQWQQQLVAFTMTNDHGQITAYAASSSVTLGTVINTGRNIWIAIQAGTTGASSEPPDSVPSTPFGTVTDGSVVWQWQNVASINGNLVQYNAMTSVAGGNGAAWVMSLNHSLQSGYIPTYAITLETDFHNNAYLCAIGGPLCASYRVSVGGNFQSTDAIDVSTSNSGSTFGAFYGVRVGANVASDTSFRDEGLGNGGFRCASNSQHSQGCFVDGSTSTNSYVAQGTYSGSIIIINGTGVTGLDMSAATVSGYQINLKGLQVGSAGGLTAASLTSTSTIASSGVATFGTGAADQIQIAGAATGTQPTIAAVGSDTNISLKAVPKGTGQFNIVSGGLAIGGASALDGSRNATLNSLSVGATTLTGTLVAASLPTSGGTVKGSLCSDTNGNIYVKTTTGSCL